MLCSWLGTQFGTSCIHGFVIWFAALIAVIVLSIRNSLLAWKKPHTVNRVLWSGMASLHSQFISECCLLYHWLWALSGWVQRQALMIWKQKVYIIVVLLERSTVTGHIKYWSPQKHPCWFQWKPPKYSYTNMTTPSTRVSSTAFLLSAWWTW